MNAKRLSDLRREAEQAVAEMPDGELKVKAFEVILAHLLRASESVPKSPTEARVVKRPTDESGKSKGAQQTLRGRILVLKDEGFFETQRAISEVKEELSTHGWHYPLTTLSGALQALVQPPSRLRRVRASLGKKKLWKYSNP